LLRPFSARSIQVKGKRNGHASKTGFSNLNVSIFNE
jgi:hypothetical protein